MEFSTEVSEKKYLFFDSTISFWKKTKIFMEMLLYHQKATEKRASNLLRGGQGQPTPTDVMAVQKKIKILISL